MNEEWKQKNDQLKYKDRFNNMLDFAEQFLGKRGFRKKTKSKSTPRARFEALAVGISLALMEKADLEISNATWIESDEFIDITRSDAANNKTKLKKRIDFVKDKLLGA